LENEIPYKNVLSYSEVRDEKGERMSKTKHNGIPFDDAVSKMGADAMRWLYCLQKSHISVNFGYSISDQIRKEFFLILWNSFKFFLNYEKINDTPTPTLIDQWLISRTNHTIKKVSNYLDKYNIASATNEISVFVNELSTWYIRRNRDRRDNYQLLNNTFTQLFGLLSPFIPYLSEYLYQFINPNQSIRLQDWPKYNSKLIDMDLEKNMLLIREICSLIHAQRQLANIKVRQPLATATIATSSPFLNEDFENIIKDETNIKKILWQETKETMTVVLDTNLTPKLIAEGEYRDFVRSIQVMRKEQKFDIQDKIQITAPSWPKDFENGILQKTLATSIKVGDTLKITKSND
jgi:isoleucyl-tRNA synthetase